MLSSSPRVHIRLGKHTELNEIDRVFRDSVSQLCQGEYGAKTIEKWIASKEPQSRAIHIKNNRLWVAVVAKKIVGFLVVCPGEILGLFIHSGHSSLGIGKALMTFGVNEARRMPNDVIKIESTLSAVQFYKHMGCKVGSPGLYTHGHSGLKLPIINMQLRCGG